MKKILSLALAAAFACGPAFAADTKADAKTTADAKTDAKMTADTKTPNSQQNKMTACQAQATEKKLESKARQDYVNNCLKAKPVAEKPESKMAMCNKKTAGMKADERAKAQSECMKG
jgi:hypothetical protein